MRRVLSAVVSQLLVSAFLLGLPGSAVAQDMNPQLAEATDFFAKLARGSQNPLIAAMATETLSKLQQSQQPKREVVVPLLLQTNNSLAVPAMLNGKTMGTFLVDTGASYTVITPRLARKLGIQVTPETPRLSIITANGLVKAPIVTVDRLAIGQVEVENVQVVIQPLGSDVMLAGLLGMNFFKGMDLAVKQNKLVLSVPQS